MKPGEETFTSDYDLAVGPGDYIYRSRPLKPVHRRWRCKAIDPTTGRQCWHEAEHVNGPFKWHEAYGPKWWTRRPWWAPWRWHFWRRIDVSWRD